MESSNKIGGGCALLVSFISVSISLFNIFHKETYTAELTDSNNISGDICAKGVIQLTLCIGTDGVVRTLKIQLPTESLTAEVQRVIAQLPVLQPARKDGKIVSVLYRYKYEIGKLEN